MPPPVEATMTTQVQCPRCRHPLMVSEEYLGGIVRCPDCRHQFTPSAPMMPRPIDPPTPRHGIRKSSRPKQRSSDAIAEAPTIPMSLAPPKPPRAARVYPSIRRSSSLPALLILGGFGALTLVLLAVLGLIAFRGAGVSDPQVAFEAEIKPMPPEEADDEKKDDVPPPPPQVVAGTVKLAPDEIYRRALKSTVYVVAKSPAPPGSPPPPPPPEPKKMTPKTMPRPPIGKTPPPKGPDLTSELTNSVWTGTEDLAGFGKLRFDFFPNFEVVVRDAKDAASGRWRFTDAKTLRIELPTAEYVGQINSDTILGTAKSKQGGVSWKFAVNRKHGATPAPMPRYITRTGTGVLVDTGSKMVVTSLHVVGEAEFVEVAFPKFDEAGDPIVDPARYQSGRIRGRVVHREPNVDVALVQLDQVPAGMELMLISNERVKTDDVVHFVGNPGERKTLWQYRPSKVRQDGQYQWKVPDAETKKDVRYDGWRIEIEGAISPGDSGGPLVSEYGLLVGLAHAADVSGNQVSYFIDASEVVTAINRYRERFEAPVAKGENAP
jgi:S1-C subfamily serine protease